MLNALFLTVGLAALLGPEVEPIPPLYGINSGGQTYDPAATMNLAGQVLAGYVTRRGDDTGWASGDNLLYVRVTAGGTVLDPGGIEAVAPGPARHQLALASDGTDYLAVWAEYAGEDISDLRAMVVGADGSVGAPVLIVSADGVAHNSPKLCFDGADYRLVYTTSDPETGVTRAYAAKLNRAATLIDGPVALSTTPDTFVRRPSMACNGTESMIAWLESTGSGAEVRGAFWPAFGDPGNASSISLPGAKQVQEVTLAEGPGGYLAVWDEQRGSAGGLALVGQLLSNSGERTSAVDLQLAPAADWPHYSKAVFDGRAWRLLTMQLVSGVEQAFMTTIENDGTVSASPSALTSSERHVPGSLACAAGKCFAAWTAGPTGAYRVGGARVGSTNQALDVPPLELSTPSDEQSRFELVWDGEQLLVMWLAGDVGVYASAQVLARRQDGRGAWIDPVPIVVGNASSRQDLVATALPEGGFAVAYMAAGAQSGKSDAVVSFVSRGGAVTDPSRLRTGFSGLRNLQYLSCGTTDCHLTIAGSVSAVRFDHHGELLTSSSPIVSDCAAIFPVQEQTWCVLPRVIGQTGLRIQRFDGSWAALGAPVVLATPNAELDYGPVWLVDAGAVILIWAAELRDPETGYLSLHVMGARVSVDGQTTLDGPRDVPLDVKNGWFLPQRLVHAKGATWLLWYANDGESFLYHLRAQQLALDTLTLGGPVERLTTQGQMLAQAAAAPTADDELVVAYLVRDSSPDRGSHRLRLRMSALAPAGPDGGVSPEDAGIIPDAAADAPSPVFDAAADADAMSDQDAIGLDRPVDADASSDAMVEVGSPADSGSSADSDGSPDVEPERRAAMSDNGCGCRVQRADRAPWLPLVFVAAWFAGMLAKRKRRKTASWLTQVRARRTRPLSRDGLDDSTSLAIPRSSGHTSPRDRAAQDGIADAKRNSDRARLDRKSETERKECRYGHNHLGTGRMS